MKYIVFAGHVGSSAKNIIVPLLDFFQPQGINVIFLHASSLTDNLDIPQREGLESFDIFLNSYSSLQTLLKTKKPVAIYGLSFRSLFDIFINRLAQQYNIPSVYFEHGLFIAGLGDKFVIADKRSSIKRYANYIKKYITFSAREKLNLPREFRNIYNCIKKNDYTNNQYNSYLFYALHGRDELYKKFKFDDKDVFYSGYPLGKLKSDTTAVATAGPKEYALYVHQPLIKDGLTDFTYEDERSLIAGLVTSLKVNNLKLIFKIHPREDINEYRERFKDLDVDVSGDTFSDLLPKCKLVVGQFSTALFYAAKYFIPLIILPYKGVNDHYYSLYTQIGVKVDDMANLDKVIAATGVLSDETYQNYLHFNKFIIGENNSFEEQAETLVKIINRVI